ncbi:MAG: ABC transporter ATP-binding protein [Spirochaetes bacterium]|nr:ABC transporter ATP-binding protein [Spirochaetota bacterium]
MHCEAIAIERRYDDFTLSASVALERGEILALVGPSGCGKTTLLRLIARLETADSGRLVLDGRDISGAKPESLGIGFVFQDHALFPHLSVRDNVAFGLAVRGMPRRARRLKADGLLDRLGLGGFGPRHVGTLSGGERQRVALARALAIDPRLILLDEPLSSVDETQRSTLRDEIRTRLRDFRMTAIYVTHDLDEAFVVADRVAVMRAGRIEGEGSPQELWDEPPTAFIAGFLDCGCVIPAEQQEDGSVQTPLGTFETRGSSSENARKGTALFFRRDRIILGGCAPEQKSPNSFTATCVGRSFVRGRWRCELDSSGFRMMLDLDERDAPTPGQTVRAGVSPADCRLLPFSCPG